MQTPQSCFLLSDVPLNAAVLPNCCRRRRPARVWRGAERRSRRQNLRHQVDQAQHRWIDGYHVSLQPSYCFSALEHDCFYVYMCACRIWSRDMSKVCLLFRPSEMPCDEVSVYDIKEHEDYTFRPGYQVIRVGGQEVQSVDILLWTQVFTERLWHVLHECVIVRCCNR